MVRVLVKFSNAPVLCVSETWLDDTISNAEVSIAGYGLELKDRRRDGGGVCIYILDNIAFNRKHEIEFDVMEFLAIDILLSKTKPILIGACYRPPKHSNFYSYSLINHQTHLILIKKKYIYWEILIQM